MRLLVCGDRHWADKSLIKKLILEYQPSVVIEGEAKGADSLGREVAQELNIKVEAYPADWNTFGRAAGSIRNKQMLDIGKPDWVVAFHDDIEHSKGTKSMLALARKTGVGTTLVSH